MLTISKRDGREQKFDLWKVQHSINQAAFSIKMELNTIEYEEVFNKCKELIGEDGVVDVEKLQNAIEKALYLCGHRKIRDSYKSYRKDRTQIRDTKSDIMKAINAIGVQTDRDNANVGNNFSAKLLRIASESNKWTQLALMPKDLAKEHENLDLYFHDLDSYNLTLNCLHIPTGQILQRGFNTGYGTINKPKRIETAADLSCILMQSTQNDMFGGQSHPNFDNDMAPFVESSRQEIAEEHYSRIGEFVSDGYFHYITKNKESIEKDIEVKVDKSVHQAMQGVVYNLNTMHCRAGSQVPFSSINIGLPESEDAALVCKAFLEEYDKGLGKGEQPIFPNIIFRVKSGVNREPSDPYYYLFKLACKVAAKRMNPTFMNIDADFNKEYYDKGYIPATMGCRTALMSNVNGDPGVEGRGNNAPTTINLPRLGIRAMLYADEAVKEVNMVVTRYDNYYNSIVVAKFFELFDEKISLSRDSLMHRYGVLKNLRVKDLPFVAGQGLMKGSEGLGPNDSIEPILKNGTWGIGFTGLAETLIAICGKHHGESEYARDLGEQIITHLRNRCDEYKEIDKMNWSCYATPAEGLSGKFVPVDRKIYGNIPGVTDKDYYTNSYHVPVDCIISIKDKIAIEAPYHKLCNGGHISYIEMDDYPDGDTIENIIRYAYENTNISYMGINFHIRYCKDCGTYLHGENECPSCDSHEIQGISRVTGYLSLDERFGPGKSAERAARTNHNGNHKNNYYLEE
jgi:ribonucleoside-triphosphate reductase